MNWITRTVNEHTDERYDLCEHLNEGDVAPHVVSENDTFGPVAKMGMCQECYEAHLAEEAEEEDYCRDCGQLKKMKELREWRWYDFYPAQGDEPRLVCDCCWHKEEHQERMRKDKADYNAEMGHLDDMEEFHSAMSAHYDED